MFARNSEKAQVWDNQQFFLLSLVQTLARNRIHILGVGLKIPPKFYDLVITEILGAHILYD